MKLLKTPCLFLAFFLLGNCNQDDDSRITRELISGYSQKGPFINGTTVTLSELSTRLDPTGNNFTTEIVDNRGTFEFHNVTLNSPFVELRANGFYFNEVGGDNSAAPLLLSAVSDVSDKTVLNVNILTHLEKGRVQYLVGHGTSFADAKKQALQEVLATFGITKTNIPSAELLDLTKDGEDNAILLAVSVITQGNRTVADLTELLANMNTDLREDGILNSEATGTDLLTQMLSINLDEVRENIVRRYDELGITNSVPDFEAYVYTFLENTEFNVSRFDVRPGALDFGENSDSLNFYVVNTGTTQVSWAIEKNNKAWYEFRQHEGTTEAGDSSKIVAVCDRTLLPVGIHTAQARITSSLGEVTLDISVNTTHVPTMQINTYASAIFDRSANFWCTLGVSQSAITEIGIAWSTSPDPSVNTAHIALTPPLNGQSNLLYYLTGLNPNTTYYVCSYGKNKSGVGYSPIVTIQTKKAFVLTDSSTVTDYDGNIYKTIKLGEQWWMAENLRSIHYANGDPLTDGTQVTVLTGDYATKYYFNNGYPAPNDGTLMKYGRFYTFAGVTNGQPASNTIPSNLQGVCPDGWHVPSYAELNILLDFAASFGYSKQTMQYSLRERGVAHDNAFYADPFHFNFMFGGIRGADFGSFAVDDWNAAMWLANQASFGVGFNRKDLGMNVRCVKD